MNTKYIHIGKSTILWEKTSFSRAFKFLKNNSLSRAELSDDNGNVKNIHYGDILIKFSECIIRKSKFPPNPERSVQFSGKRTKRSVQKKGCTQHL